MFGEHSLTYNFSFGIPQGNITVGFTSCCWRHFNSWSVSTTFSLAIRNDTNEINSTPRASIDPVIRLQAGCNHRMSLPVHDPDGDIIRCRWAVGSECSDVCGGIPGAILDPTTCTIAYQANRGLGYKAVAVMIEDFTPNSPDPLSSVALQFLVLIIDNSTSLSPAVSTPGKCVVIALCGV